ncbi:MAG: RluA family pseudouridine synthase [Lachnospiraceae bacterium]
MQEITVGSNQQGQRFDKLLQKVLPEASTSFLYKMLRKKNITLNNKKAEGKEMLASGDVIKIFLADETYVKFGGKLIEGTTSMPSEAVETKSYEQAYKQLQEIEIVYEDEQVLVANKPSGILSQKASATDVSLNEWLIGYLLAHNKITARELVLFKPSICNRLDRNTSGLILCGKSLKGTQVLNQWVKDRSVKKFYRLFVAGRLEKGDHIKGYLTKNKKTNKVTVTTTPQGDSSEIETIYKPLAFYEDITYVEVELITGKTHQIRAHLASILHPLVGDFKYGDALINQVYKEKFGIKDQMLHAYRLAFPVHDIEELQGLSGKVIFAKEPQIYDQIKMISTKG